MYEQIGGAYRELLDEGAKQEGLKQHRIPGVSFPYRAGRGENSNLSQKGFFGKGSQGKAAIVERGSQKEGGDEKNQSQKGL